MKRTLFLILPLVLLFACCTKGGGGFSDTLGKGVEPEILNEKYIMRNIDTLEISWKKGNVLVAPYDGDEILVREKSSSVLRPRTSFSTQVNDGKLYVAFTSTPISFFPFFFQKELEVLIPQGKDLKALKIETRSASVRVENLSVMDLEAKSISGSVTLSSMLAIGSASVTSVSGSVSLEGEAALDMAMKSVSGSVSVRVGGDIRNASLKSTSGGVSLDAGTCGHVTCTSVSGGVMMTLSDAESIEGSSTSGSVRLYYRTAPRGFLMEATSKSGAVRCAFPTRFIGDMYSYGDGSTSIKLRSVSGSITVTGE